KSFWMSIDLVGMPMTFDEGTDGNCEGLSTIFGDGRGTKETLEDFIDSQDFAFGIHSLADVDSTIISDWRSDWSTAGYDTTYGAWRDVNSYMSSAAFTASLVKWVPSDADVVFGYELDSSTWTLSLDTSGAPVLIDVSSATALPTGYFDTVPLYYYGSGF